MSAWVTHNFLTLVRIAAFVGTMPALGQELIPKTVKLSLAISLALLLTQQPSEATQAINTSWVGIAVGVGRELVVGALLGFSCGLILDAVKITGAYFGHQVGLALGGSENLTDNEAISMFGQLLEIFTIVVLFSVNAHHTMLLGIAQSTDLLPVGEPFNQMLGQLATRYSLSVTEVGLLIGGPLFVTLFAVTIFTAVLMRASPQFSLFSVGIPLRVAAGLLGLLFWFPHIIGVVTRLLLSGKFMIFGN